MHRFALNPLRAKPRIFIETLRKEGPYAPLRIPLSRLQKEFDKILALIDYEKATSFARTAAATMWSSVGRRSPPSHRKRALKRKETPSGEVLMA